VTQKITLQLKLLKQFCFNCFFQFQLHSFYFYILVWCYSSSDAYFFYFFSSQSSQKANNFITQRNSKFRLYIMKKDEQIQVVQLQDIQQLAIPTLIHANKQTKKQKYTHKYQLIYSLINQFNFQANQQHKSQQKFIQILKNIISYPNLYLTINYIFYFFFSYSPKINLECFNYLCYFLTFIKQK
ncbi:transmembrane protein, putative, partial (macronuclear) [Tetrahymena thermophila SB210]